MFMLLGKVLETGKAAEGGISMVSDFIGAAFPWVVMGLFAAIICAFMSKKGK